MKSPSSSPIHSPRLRSPRGSRYLSTSNTGGFFFGVLRRARILLCLLTIAIVCLLRPSSIDPGNDLTTFATSGFHGDAPKPTQSSPASYTDDDNEGDDDLAMPQSDDGKVSVVWVAPVSVSEEEEEDDVDDDFLYDSNDAVDEASEREIYMDDQKTPVVQRPSTNLRQSSKSRPSFLNSTRSSSLFAYDPLLHPLLEKQELTDTHLIVDVSSGAVGPPAKFLLDGLERSPLTNVVGLTFLNPNIHQVSINARKSKQMVWLVDWASMLRDCHRLERALTQLKRKKTEHVLLVDYSGSTRQTFCPKFAKDPNVRLAKRSIVKDRFYNHTTGESKHGRIATNRGKELPGGNVLHAPLVVRERFVSALLNVTRDRNPLTATRRTDVCHFWKPNDFTHYGFWRRKVGRFVESLGDSFNYTTIVDVVANDMDGMELGNIQLKYVTSLIHCKIVVIAQRDEWEDHYRLYESLASGALVLTDSMKALPPGLKHKTNVLIYDNLESLEKSIHFYLEHKSRRISIGRRGMQLSLGRYRSWHRVEELLFGEPLSISQDPTAEPPPKMARPPISLVDGSTVTVT